MKIVIQAALLVIGFIMLMKGADWFVEGASKIAGRFGISQLVVGLTIVAMGTSAPEAAVSISAAVRGSAGITIGNVLGSNILNTLVILGITSCIRPVPVGLSTIRIEMPFVILVTALLACLGLHDYRLSRPEGGLLWVFMILYLLYLLRMAKKGKTPGEEISEASERDTLPGMAVTLVIGLVLVVWGSDVTVDAASALARVFGMSDRFIGLTVVALGTSLPELVTSAAAAVKGKTDIAVGNIVGSNIFNILFVVGTTALIAPVAYSPDFTADSIAAIAASILLLLCVIRRKRLTRKGGCIMLACYVGYFLWLLS